MKSSRKRAGIRAVSHVGDEPVEVEPEGVRVARSGLAVAKAILVLEERVVHLPEPALRAGSLGSLGRLDGVRVDLRQRKVAVSEPQVVAERSLRTCFTIGCAAPQNGHS